MAMMKGIQRNVNKSRERKMKESKDFWLNEIENRRKRVMYQQSKELFGRKNRTMECNHEHNNHRWDLTQSLCHRISPFLQFRLKSSQTYTIHKRTHETASRRFFRFRT